MDDGIDIKVYANDTVPTERRVAEY